MRRLCLFILSFVSFLTIAKAQRNEIFNDRIQSLTVIADNDWQALPVMELGSSISIGFDDMTHEYHRYAYRIEPCNADWTPNNQLFESDFINGFTADNIIEDVEESVLTTKNYTHYKFTISGIKLSGNYKVTVYDNNANDKPLICAYFMVVEPKETSMGVSMSVTTSTDASINQRHQQLGMEVNYSGYNVTRPMEQIHTVVLQNGQWHDARTDVKPQYIIEALYSMPGTSTINLKSCRLMWRPWVLITYIGILFSIMPFHLSMCQGPTMFMTRTLTEHFS